MLYRVCFSRWMYWFTSLSTKYSWHSCKINTHDLCRIISPGTELEYLFTSVQYCNTLSYSNYFVCCFVNYNCSRVSIIMWYIIYYNVVENQPSTLNRSYQFVIWLQYGATMEASSCAKHLYIHSF